jgi:hypothetical protein
MDHLTTIIGGADVSVTYRQTEPGSQSTETVHVRQLSVRDMQTYLGVYDDEAKSVELFCSKPDGWADSLTPDSHERVMEKGQELNLPFFESWYQRRLKRTETLMPGFRKKMESAAASAAQEATERARQLAAGNNGAATPSPSSAASSR